MGRPNKGTRVRMVTRIPVALHTQVVQSAARQHTTISEYVATVLAQHHDR